MTTFEKCPHLIFLCVIGYDDISSVAPIWFEIWGVVDPGKKIDFSRQISENYDFFQAISNKKINFFQPISQKISIFQTKFGHSQLLLGKLFCFSSKVTTFEHTSCT